MLFSGDLWDFWDKYLCRVSPLDPGMKNKDLKKMGIIRDLERLNRPSLCF